MVSDLDQFPSRRAFMPWGGLLAAICLLGQVKPVRARLPEMVKPEFLETGVPSFVTSAGDDDLSSTGTTGPEDTDPGSAPGTTGTGGGTGASVATNYTQYLGQSVGSGQCVALLQAADPNVGRTATWSQGDAVRGNTSLQPGTAIATFGPNGTYTNSMDGSSHAAIYLGQNAQGIQVLDQWAGYPAAYRTIRWDNAGTAANNGSKFNVIAHTG